MTGARIGLMAEFRQSLPWWARIGAKVLLARLPVPYRIWKQLKLFEHGDMNEPERALDSFLQHARTAGVVESGPPPRIKRRDSQFAVLEIGPGDSLFTAVIAHSLGASRSWLVDAGPFASTEISRFADLFELLRDKGIPLCSEGKPRSLADILRQCDAEYLTEGLKSLSTLPADSVDYCFSNAVLEHVPRQEMASLARELFRIVKPDGVCVHRVDLTDHLGGALNNLRFSDAVWEGKLFRTSGFYTNRVRFAEMLAVFGEAGFRCDVSRVIRWEKLPTPRAKLHSSFRNLHDEDLLVSEFDLVLQRKASA